MKSVWYKKIHALKVKLAKKLEEDFRTEWTEKLFGRAEL